MRFAHNFYLNAFVYYTISPLQDYKCNLCSGTQNPTLFSTSYRVISQWIFSNHMLTYLWNDIYENLVVESVGLNLFSLLVSSSWSNVDAISFGCVIILSVYLTLNFVISSLIIGTFRSACMTLLDICDGAFTIARKDFILISLKYFSVWITSCTPLGYSVCPDGL